MDTDTSKYVGKVKAPGIPAYADWLNTRKSYTLNDLKGKVVLLDFWTYCCINCMHVLPDLKRLEQKYPELVVIGVHSAKFKGEKGTENIKEAIIRYDIEHPVINDHKFDMWNRYGVQAWPTLVLVDPAGKVVGSVSGEGNYELLDSYIEGILAHYKPLGQVKEGRFEFELEKYRKSNSLLSYPSKMEADSKGKRLFITDSNNDRILVTGPGGEIQEVIGSGRPGRADGSFEEASFFRPQGIVYDAVKDRLYIADTENHLIREADLNSRSVRTIAGTGEQAGFRSMGGRALEAALNSPWDLALEGDKLQIAMAGPHQLWTLDLGTEELSILAGNGRENITDGPADVAELAQPSGITKGGNALYFADSETSSIRKLENGEVETLIGSGLFTFGDKDGKYDIALLQHPLGVFFLKDKLYVADTYNNKIKEIDLASGTIKTLVGTGRSGSEDGPSLKAGLNEPNDITWLEGKFYISDTNNDLIRVYDPATGEVNTLELSGIEKIKKKIAPEEFSGKIREFPVAGIGKGSSTLRFRFSLPEGHKINTLAPNDLEVISRDEEELQVKAVRFDAEDLTAEVDIESNEAKAGIDLYLSLYYCDERNAAKCMYEELKLVQPLKPDNSSTGTIKLDLRFLARQP